MTFGERNDIEGLAILKYGKTHQVHKCIEEMSELTKELIKDINGEGDYDHILEEYADLIITLEEIRMIYGFVDTDISKNMGMKLNRLMKRMEKETPIEHCDNSAHVNMAYNK